jgi:hypothetical protein
MIFSVAARLSMSLHAPAVDKYLPDFPHAAAVNFKWRLERETSILARVFGVQTLQKEWSMANPISGESSGPTPGVSGVGTGAVGVFGSSDAFSGVLGWGTTTGNGVEGAALQSGSGVYGKSQSGYGVYGFSQTNDGVYGVNGAMSGSKPSAMSVEAKRSIQVPS